MTMRRLYKTCVAIPMVVLAENEQDAIRLSMKHVHEEHPAEYDVSLPTVIDCANDLPRGWDVRCLPYSDARSSGREWEANIATILKGE